MDLASTRRRSQGISSKPPVQGSLQGTSGMKTSLSRPDSFLPTNNHSLTPSLEQYPTVNSTILNAATSGSEISKDRLIQLLSSVEDEYDKVVKENAQLRIQIAQMSQSSLLFNTFTEGSSAPYQPSTRFLLGSAPSSKFAIAAQTASSEETHSPPQMNSVDNSFHKLKVLKEEQLQKFKTTSRRKIASATSRLRNVPTADAQIVRNYVRHNDGIWDIVAPKASSCPYAVFGKIIGYWTVGTENNCRRNAAVADSDMSY